MPGGGSLACLEGSGKPALQTTGNSPDPYLRMPEDWEVRVIWTSRDEAGAILVVFIFD